MITAPGPTGTPHWCLTTLPREGDIWGDTPKPPPERDADGADDRSRRRGDIGNDVTRSRAQDARLGRADAPVRSRDGKGRAGPAALPPARANRLRHPRR